MSRGCQAVKGGLWGAITLRGFIGEANSKDEMFSPTMYTYDHRQAGPYPESRRCTYLRLRAGQLVDHQDGSQQSGERSDTIDLP